ncbi:hypothetical protein ACOME3_002258 [Neoechinorhynchus agilis]
MIQTRSLVLLALLSAAGLSLLVFSCALANYNWWPSLVVIFYVAAPIPICIAHRIQDQEFSNTRDFMIFSSSALVTSSFALPVVLARAEVIKVGSMVLSIIANIVIFCTTSYYMKISSDEPYYY